MNDSVKEYKSESLNHLQFTSKYVYQQLYFAKTEFVDYLLNEIMV